MLTTRPLSFFKPDPGQSRKSFDEGELRALGASMRSVGQLQPVGAKPDGTLLWGERRWRAAQLVGIPELSVIITDRPMSDTEVRLVQLSENLHRSDLTDPEIFTACQELLALNPDWRRADLGAYLHKDASMVTRILSVGDLIPAARQAFMDGKFRFGTAYAISKLPPDEQAEMLALQLSGRAGRARIEQAAKKKEHAAVPAVKVARVWCPLPTGRTVVVSGPAMSLEDLIGALGQALEAAKRASKESLDVKTAEKVWKDKAKAGA
jgi:ParB/RepB/Spo0J family partition protein